LFRERGIERRRHEPRPKSRLCHAGTDGSNPASSSGESGTNRAAAAGDIRAPMRGRRKRIAKTVGCSRQTVSDVLVVSGFAENSHLTEIGKLLFRATQHQGGA
ncbi:MAG TPA: hypothetical protein VHT21_03060, partial [Stellaceae bacterium]|nr:hypothetical protein [Stellaceae bacterium]